MRARGGLNKYLLRKDFFSRAREHVRVEIVRRLRKSGLKDQAYLLTGVNVAHVFDVGAHVGDLTAEYLSAFPGANAYCFEPFPETLRSLQDRFADNPRVHTIGAAISDRTGQASLYVRPVGGMNSLFRPLEGAEREIVVPTLTLDDFCAQERIDHIDILKMDIEGAEIRALRGATACLTAGKFRLIYVEARFVAHHEGAALFHHIASHLEAFGYQLHNLYDIVESSARSVIYGNALFLNPQMQTQLRTRLGTRAFLRRY